MAQNIIDQIRAIVSTSNSTQTFLYEYTDLPSDSSFVMTSTIIARNTNNGDTATFWKTITGKKIGSTITLVGSILDQLSTQKDLSLSLSNVVVDGNNGNLRIRVTGTVTATIEWMLVGTILIN